MLPANENTYLKLSTFKSVEELNEAIKAHKQAHALTPTERAVLDVISRYACKYPGVCYLSKNNIGEAVGRVRRTVIRVCKRLEALGIITQYETKRPAGDRRQSTNVIVVLAFRSSEVGATCHVQPTTQDVTSDNNSVVQQVHEQTGNRFPTSSNQTQVTPDMSRHEAPFKKLNNIIYNNTYLKPFYARFKSLIHSTLGNNQRLISRLFGVYKAHSTPLLRGQAFDKKDVEQAGWQALKAVVMATKSKNIRNLAGYYNGVLDRMLDRLYFEEMGVIGGLHTPVYT